MGRKRKAWSESSGSYGSTVRIYEPRPGAPLRFDYRDEDGVRRRPQVEPEFRVRPSPGSPVDPILERRAKELAAARELELRGRSSSEPTEAEALTVAGAFSLRFDPRRRALPVSRSGRTHWTSARGFWTEKLGAGRLWNSVPPADVWGPLLELREAGQVQTAKKRLQVLRGLTRWLQRSMRIRGLEDPTLGLEVAKLMEGYTPRRPRLTKPQVQALRRVLGDLNPRTRLFFRMMTGSVTRAIQARTLMRSGLDAALEPPMDPELAPHGWILTAAVKGQDRQLLLLTRAQRAAIEEALSTYLFEWETQFRAGELDDFPLLPGGRLDQEGGLEMEPISDRALRYELKPVFDAAGIGKEPGDRKGFHAIRRAMSDIIEEEEGLDTLQAAGGWKKRETIEGHGYTEREKRRRIARAREHLEEE